MRNLRLILVVLGFISSSIFAQNIIPVAAGPGAISIAFTTASAGDILELTTDGGIYAEAATLIIDKKITIRAAGGLSQKPVITSGSTSSMIEFSADFLLDGVILDGAQGEALTPIGITNKSNTSGYDLTVSNSEFLNFSDAGATTGFGIFGNPSSVVDSVFVQNCYFAHILDMGISFNDPLTSTGSVNHFKVDNSTFWDMNSEAIYVDGFDSSVATKDPQVYVNKVTVYDCGSYNIIPHYIDSAVITNSIVVLPTMNTSYAPAKIYGAHSKIENFLYFNTRDIDLSSGATDFQLLNVIVQEDPLFKDASAGDFTITDSSPAYRAGTDGKPLGDDKWWSIDVPEFIFLAAGENVISSALATAVDGQTIVLTSDGGIYNETAKLIIDKKIKIIAGDGLVNRPTLTSGSTAAMIEISADFLLKGVILDGSLGGALTAIGITNKPNTSGYDLTVLESDFLNFSDAGATTGFGIFGNPGSVVDSVFIQNCYFAHILDMGISFNDPLTSTGSVNHFKVDNSTFWDMNSEAIYVDGFDSNVGTKDPQVCVNKVTVYDCGSYNIIPHYIDSAVISNSIVVLPTMNTSYAPAKIYGAHSKIENFLYFNTRDIDLSSGATDFQLFNIIVQEDPLFTDAANGLFFYPISSPAVMMGENSEQILTGDERWWPEINTGIEDNKSNANSGGFELNQNYPNPFSAFTKISYSIPVSGKVVLKVYNAFGSEVMMLVNENKNAGSYEINLNASSLAKGIYTYKIQVGSFTASKKLVLIK